MESASDVESVTLQTKSDQPSRIDYHFAQIPIFPGDRPIQPKLTIGAASDKYEQEADRVADQVMNASATSIQRTAGEEDELQMKPLADGITPLVQREAEEEELQTKPIQREADSDSDEDELQMKPIQRETDSDSDEDELQMKPIQREAEEEELQMKSAVQRTGVESATSSLETRLSQSRGGGSALPDETRSFMESRFGVDFGSVRIHTGSNAVQMNREVSAQAFTHGSNVYFNAGKFDPSSNTGKHLLAHELTHVVQQTGANPLSVQRRVEISAANTPSIQRQLVPPPSTSPAPGSSTSTGSSSTTAPTTTPSTSVAAAMWTSSAVQPVREAGEAIRVDDAGETQANDAMTRLMASRSSIDSLLPTYRDTGREATRRRLAQYSNYVGTVVHKLAPYTHAELSPLPVIGQAAARLTQMLSQSTNEIATQGATGNNAAERAIARRALASMWNASIVEPERNISRMLRQPGASSATAETALQTTSTMETTLLNIGDSLRENGKESTARLAELNFSRLLVQDSVLEPHAGREATPLAEIAEALDELAGEMEGLTSELFPPRL
jgi:hypothetical protein